MVSEQHVVKRWFKKLALKRPQNLLVYLVEEVRLVTYGWLFIGVVVGFALVYYWQSPGGHGLLIGGNPELPISFQDALYFSVVTVSSLGYGDIAPAGFSRLLACVEVMFGVTMLGIIVAKATSYRVAYHVERLFSSDIQDRMHRHAQDFDTLAAEVRAIARGVAMAFDIPVDGAQQHKRLEDQHSVKERFSRASDLLEAHTVAVADYISYELEHDRFFNVAPQNALVRVTTSMDTVFFAAGQMIAAMAPAVRETLIDATSRMKLSRAYLRQLELATMVEQHCPHGDVRDGFTRLSVTCSGFPRAFFETPRVDANSPDLTMPLPNDPQIA